MKERTIDFYQFSLFDNNCNSLRGLKVVITGILPLPRKNAIQAILISGGLYGVNVSRKTDILVVGSFHKGKEISKKLDYARTLQSHGSKIQIISPEEFFNMLSAC